jgi:hypothetical protein
MNVRNICEQNTAYIRNLQTDIFSGTMKIQGKSGPPLSTGVAAPPQITRCSFVGISAFPQFGANFSERSRGKFPDAVGR